MRTPYPNELKHYGIPGMRKGVRRFQNEDGSLTAAGRARYGVGVTVSGQRQSMPKRSSDSSGPLRRQTLTTSSSDGSSLSRSTTISYVDRKGRAAGSPVRVDGDVRFKARSFGSRLKDWWSNTKARVSRISSSVRSAAKNGFTAIMNALSKSRREERARSQWSNGNNPNVWWMKGANRGTTLAVQDAQNAGYTVTRDRKTGRLTGRR